VVRLNGVHAFGYKSAGSEQIWMKFGALRVYCLELALTDFGRDPSIVYVFSDTKPLYHYCAKYK